MTDEKMMKIKAWLDKATKNKAAALEVSDKMTIANATVKMLEAIEPVYDKYNGGGRH